MGPRSSSSKSSRSALIERASAIRLSVSMLLSKLEHCYILTGFLRGPVARIPEEEIERLKDEVSLERLVEAAGVALRRQGRDLVGCCPFHEDRSPSLVVSPGENLWHCLGACQAGGSVIDWVMRSEGVSFRHAVDLLRGRDRTGGGRGRGPASGTIDGAPAALAA